MNLKTKSIANGNVLILLFVVSIVVQALVFNALQMDFMLHAVIAQVGMWFLPFPLYLIITRQKPKNVLNLTIPNVKSVLFAMLLGITLVPVVITLTLLIPLLNNLIFPAQAIMTSEFLATVPSFWVLILMGAVFPAIFEEIWFRGIFFDHYRNGVKKASILATGIATGLIFGLIHSDLAQIIYAIPFGILFAFLVHYSRSIWVPIITHFVINGLSFTLGYFQPTPEVTEYAIEAAEVSPWETIIFFGVIALLMVPVIFLCMKKFKKYYKDTQTAEDVATEPNVKSTEKPKIFTWPLCLAILVLLVRTLLFIFGVI